MLSIFLFLALLSLESEKISGCNRNSMTNKLNDNIDSKLVTYNYRMDRPDPDSDDDKHDDQDTVFIVESVDADDADDPDADADDDADVDEHNRLSLADAVITVNTLGARGSGRGRGQRGNRNQMFVIHPRSPFPLLHYAGRLPALDTNTADGAAYGSGYAWPADNIPRTSFSSSISSFVNPVGAGPLDVGRVHASARASARAAAISLGGLLDLAAHARAAAQANVVGSNNGRGNHGSGNPRR